MTMMKLRSQFGDANRPAIRGRFFREFERIAELGDVRIRLVACATSLLFLPMVAPPRQRWVSHR